MNTAKVITPEEMIEKIDKVCKEYRGDGSKLLMIVGMLVVGRLYGWKVIRLIAPRRLWSIACEQFGDLKELLPEEGRLAYKSVGFTIITRVGQFWDVIRGESNIDHDKRRKII